MKMPRPLYSLFPALLILALSSTAAGQRRRDAGVVVLSTLHNLHENSKYYSFETLARTIERIRPDVIVVELTPADLASRRKQKVKTEYERAVFPVADKHGYKLVAMEPAPAKFAELVGFVQSSEKELRDNSPQKAEAFSAYSDALYEYLFRKWDSPLAVNSTETDALFEVKHAYQNKLFGAKRSYFSTASSGKTGMCLTCSRPNTRFSTNAWRNTTAFLTCTAAGSGG